MTTEVLKLQVPRTGPIPKPTAGGRKATLPDGAHTKEAISAVDGVFGKATGSPVDEDPQNSRMLADVKVDWIRVKPVKMYHDGCCALCEKPEEKNVGTVVINGTEFRIAQCKYDGHMWMNPRPDKDFIKELYGKEYFRAQGEDTSQVGIPDRGNEEVQRREAIAQKQVDEWLTHGAINREIIAGQRMIEIGGGAGYLSGEAQKRGLSVLNIEICKERASECTKRGVPVYNGFLEAATNNGVVEKDSCDIVACYDLLEHILEPNPFLSELHSVLKENGILALRVPNTPEEGPRLHLVDHVNHFTLDSLKGILHKNGFDMFHQHHSGTFYGPDDLTIENVTVFARKIV